MNRFLRSRIFPILSIIVLSFSSLLIEGYILWGVKIKEDFFLTGEVNISPAHDVIKVLPFRDGNFDLPSLQTGAVVRVGISDNFGEEIFINTEFVNLEGEGGAENIVLKPIKTDSENNLFFLAAMEEKRIKKIHLITRKKRLLVAAFEKNVVVQRAQ